MKTFLFALVPAVLLSAALVAQPLNQELYLIPVPKQIILKPGRFEFSNEVNITGKYLENIGVEEFTELLKTELGLTVNLNQKSSGKNIRIEKRKDIGCKSDEGYLLEITPKEVSITATSGAGLFYGIQTLSQLITSNWTGRSVPCISIKDYPDIPIRGWQDDISRGPIPTMEFLKKEVRTLAAFKLNAITLYTEHVFKMKQHPTLAPDDGITQEQIAELSEYAEKYHVQVIGNFQSFGHMEKILSKPGYQHLAESGHILTPTKEESYQFMKEVYSEVVPAYSSAYFNINCDETFGLGESLSKKMADSIGIEGIYGYHINRLNDLLKPYQKRILMWGDIAANPKIVALLPRDITVISWGYHDAASFDYAIKPFSDQGLNFWVAPGVSCWGNIYPNLKVANVNISNYIRDGYKLGATGVLNTSWMDDGMNFTENNWYGFVWGAEKCWTAPVADEVDPSAKKQNSTFPLTGHSESAFDQAFDKIFFGMKAQSVTSWMKALSSLHQSKVRDIARSSRIFEPVLPFYPEYIDDSQLELNGLVLAKLDSLQALLPGLKAEVMRNGIDLDYLDFALAEVRFSANKNIFRIELYRYLKKLNGAISAESLKTTLKILIRQSEQLKTRYSDFWKQVNRDWWLERNMAKFDQLNQDLWNIRGLTILTISDTLTPAGRSLKMHSMLDNLPVYYTLNGQIPTLNSNKFSGEIMITSDVTIRARVIAEGKEFPESADSLIIHKAIGKLHKLNSTWSAYHPAYDAGGRYGLLDGRTGNVNDIRSGRWQGYSGQDINVELDFGRLDTLHSIAMNFYQTTFSWVILPKQVDIYTSDDGINYRKYKAITHTVPVNIPQAVTHLFEADLNNLITRYLKVVGVYSGPLPDFHSSKGEQSLMFADEIVIR